MLGDTDISTFLSDFGELVTAGDRRVRGIFSAPGAAVELAGVEISATQPSLVFATAELPDIAAGTRLEIGTRGAFEVRDVSAGDDGLFSTATLREV